MKLKPHFILLVLGLIFTSTTFAQTDKKDRLAELTAKLETFALQNKNLNQEVDISMASSVQEVISFLAASTELNVGVDPGINQPLSASFSSAKAKDILLFVCDSYDLDLRFTGDIIRVIKYQKEPLAYREKELLIEYNKYNDLLTLDLNRDTLAKVVKQIVKLTNKNIVLDKQTRNLPVTAYIQQVKLEEALSQLAQSNDLLLKEEEGFYALNQLNNTADNTGTPSRSNSRSRKRPAGLRLNSTDSPEGKLLSVEASNVSLQELLEQISLEAGVDYFIYEYPSEAISTSPAQGTRLPGGEQSGTVSVNLHDLSYEKILAYLLKETNSTFRQENGVYLIGERSDEPLRTTKVVQIMHRPVEDILEVIPAGISEGVTIKPLPKLNSLILSGSRPNIEEIESVVLDIDKSVPNVNIELIIVDMTRTRGVSTGIQAGIDPNVQSGGTIFPGVDFTFSSKGVNHILDLITGTGIVNLGHVLPDFYLSLQAVEDIGWVNVRSKPQLSTLNGQEATFKIGETQYYLQEDTRVDAGVTPVVSQTRRFESVSADFTVTIKPVISGDEHVTLEITVVQSDFTPATIQNAPPGQISREFTSVIRVKDEEMIVLGGLESKSREETGRGVPLLSRIPVLKWFFSSKTKRREKSELVIFVKPKIIY